MFLALVRKEAFTFLGECSVFLFWDRDSLWDSRSSCLSLLSIEIIDVMWTIVDHSLFGPFLVCMHVGGGICAHVACIILDFLIFQNTFYYQSIMFSFKNPSGNFDCNCTESAVLHWRQFWFTGTSGHVCRLLWFILTMVKNVPLSPGERGQGEYPQCMTVIRESTWSKQQWSQEKKTLTISSIWRQLTYLNYSNKHGLFSHLQFFLSVFQLCIIINSVLISYILRFVPQ